MIVILLVFYNIYQDFKAYIHVKINVYVLERKN